MKRLIAFSTLLILNFAHADTSYYGVNFFFTNHTRDYLKIITENHGGYPQAALKCSLAVSPYSKTECYSQTSYPYLPSGYIKLEKDDESGNCIYQYDVIKTGTQYDIQMKLIGSWNMQCTKISGTWNYDLKNG